MATLIILSVWAVVCAQGKEPPKPQTPAAGRAERMPDSAGDEVKKGTFCRMNSRGWYWIYQAIAHAQFFVSNGQPIRELRVPVARLNNNIPAAPLEVEIRNASPDSRREYDRKQPTATPVIAIVALA